MMELFTILLLIGLVVCAVSASLAKNLLNTLLIFMISLKTLIHSTQV